MTEHALENKLVIDWGFNGVTLVKHLELSVSIDFTSDSAYDVVGDTGILEEILDKEL